MLTRGAHADGGRVGQPDEALLADRLALNVVAVLAVDEDLQIDADALGGLEEHDLRVLEVGEPLARGAWGDHLGGDHLVVEEPAQYVHLVHGRVQGGHVGGVRLRDGRVAVGAVHDQRLTDATGVDDLFHLPVSGVVAAHEADLDQAAAVCRLGLDDPHAVLGGGGQRLLAEHRFPGGYRGQHVLGVGRAPGRHEDRVDVVRRDHGRAVGQHPGTDRRRGLLGTRGVDVGDRGDAGACDGVGEALDVFLADPAGADDAYTYGHGQFLQEWGVFRRSAPGVRLRGFRGCGPWSRGRRA